MVVSNDSIVDDGDAASMVEVRMRIDIGLVTVSSPPSVPNSNVFIMLSRTLNSHALDAVASEAIRASKLGHRPLRLLLFIVVDGDNAAAVVAT